MKMEHPEGLTWQMGNSGHVGLRLGSAWSDASGHAESSLDSHRGSAHPMLSLKTLRLHLFFLFSPFARQVGSSEEYSGPQHSAILPISRSTRRAL